LALSVCQLIFGKERAQQAEEISEFMFAADKVSKLKNASSVLLQAIAKEVNGSVDCIYHDGNSVLDVLVQIGLCESRGESKKLIEQG
jgi:tyrosyl-tRNA synthetase